MTTALKQLEQLLALLERIDRRYGDRWSYSFREADYDIVVDEAQRFARQLRRTLSAPSTTNREQS